MPSDKIERIKKEKNKGLKYQQFFTFLNSF